MKFFLVILISLVACTERSSSVATNSIYEKLIQKFDENRSLEDRAFDQLVFTPSETKANHSLNFKFVVKDQLEREWLFKAGPAASVDAITRLESLPSPLPLAAPSSAGRGPVSRFTPPIRSTGRGPPRLLE